MDIATVMEDSAGQPHNLLETPKIEFSKSVQHRACIVSKVFGHKMDYQLICKYYHRLEALEATMTVDNRIKSRHLEYNLLSTPPPVTPFFLTYFPNVYPVHEQNLKESDSSLLQSNIYNLQEHKDIAQSSNSSTELVNANQMIRNYCQSHQISIRQFIENFKQHATQTGLNPTVSNVAFYIKYMMMLEERQLQANLEQTAKFPDTDLSPPSVQSSTANNNVTMLFQYYANMYSHHSIYGRNYTVNRAEVNHDTPNVRNFFKKFNTKYIYKGNTFDTNWGNISKIRNEINKECSGEKPRIKSQRKTVVEDIFGVVLDNKKSNVGNVAVGKLIDVTMEEKSAVETEDLNVDNKMKDNLKYRSYEMNYEPNLELPEVGDSLEGKLSMDSFNLIDFSLSDYSTTESSTSTQSIEKGIDLNLSKNFKELKVDRCSSSHSSSPSIN